MRAVNTGDDPDTYSDPSETRNAIQLVVPTKLTGVTADAGNAEVMLSWSPPPADEIVINYDYRIDPNPDDGSTGWTKWQSFTTDSNSHKVTGLTNGTTYSFQVRAKNLAGDGPDSETVTATPSGPPGAVELRAHSTGGTEVRLYWSNPNDSSITKYQIRQEGVSQWGDIAFLSTVDIAIDDPIVYTVTGLTVGTTYTFNVRAINNKGTGAIASVTATPTTSETTPAQMADVGHTVTGVTGGSGGTVTFNWDDPGDDSIDKYQYRYHTESSNPVDWTKCRDDTDGCGVDWTDIPGGTANNKDLTSWTVGIHGSSTTVFYELRAVNTHDSKMTPAELSPHLFGPAKAVTVSRANTPTSTPSAPHAPTVLTAAGATGQIELSWTAPSGTLIGFQYRQSTDGGSSWSPDWTDIPTSAPGEANAASFTKTSLTNGFVYTFEVRAVAGTADSPVYGAGARVSGTAGAAPNQPTGLAVASVNDDTTTAVVKENETQLALSWTLPTDITGVTITSFEYRQRRSGAPNWEEVWIPTGVGATDTSYTVTDLLAGTTYEFQVRATAGSVVSGPSVAASGMTAEATEKNPPAAPTGLTAGAGNASVTLRWTGANDRTLTQYLYLQCAAPDDCAVDANFSEFGMDSVEIDDAPTADSYTVTGLTNGIAYTFKILARNADGGSPASEAVTATPSEQQPQRTEPADERVKRLERISEMVVPEVTRAIAASTLSAVTGRIEAVASGAVPTVNIAGQSTLHQALTANARALEEGMLDLQRVLAGSSFALSLNAAEGDKAGGVGDIGVWGSGDYRNLSGGDASAVEWDGEVWSGHLGADARLRENLLAGLSASFSQGSFDYTDRTTGTAADGALESRMTSLNPYVSWSVREDLDLWATLGYGWGEIEIDDDAAAPVSSDLTQWSGALGASGTLLTSDDWIAGGTTRLKLKGEGSLARGRRRG